MAKVMKASDFVDQATYIATKIKTLYIMGCFGAPMNSSNKYRYTHNSSYNMQSARVAKINAASSDTFGFDCVCLIKGILWGFSADKNRTYGGSVYASNGVADVDADQMINGYCTNVSSDFSNIAKGELVWTDGHIGIYIGDGYAVECTPIWKDGVQITAVRNIGYKSGFNNRTWKKHGKSIYIDYTASSSQKKSNDEIADEVIAGKWGNGQTRKDKLTAAGYDYTVIQTLVNRKLSGSSSKKSNEEIANEVLAGKWGNGQTRKDKLTKAGYNYDAIQAIVNKKIAESSAKKVYHTVVRGDTVSKLAAKYGSTVSQIASWNNLKNVNYIVVGQKLRVK